MQGRPIGASLPRIEDQRFVRGLGRYLADLDIPGLAEIAFVRSDQAHARIRRLNTVAAKSLPGVIAVVSGTDLVGRVQPFTRAVDSPSQALLDRYQIMVRPYHAELLPVEEIFRVGEPIAVVVAIDAATAEDGARLVEVDYDRLPVVANVADARAQDAIQLHPEVPGNVAAEVSVSVGDPEVWLAAAPHRLRERFIIHRSIGSPIGMRGAVAYWDRNLAELTLWSTTQRPHVLRSFLSEMLHLSEQRVRVIAPDVGGSFGGAIYSEEVLVAFLAMFTGRAVRWLEGRSESLINSRHSRDQSHEIEVGFDDEGRILAIRDTFTIDCGAYNPYGINLLYNTISHLRGQYDIRHMSAQGSAVLTNKLQVTPVRGTGRPEAAFVMERVVDIIARQLQRDSVEVRLTNLIPGSAMPYRTGILYRDGREMIYDSGDYPVQLETALDAIDYRAFRAHGRHAAEDGQMVGIGLASHIEGTGSGPFEGATVQLDREGFVTVRTGASSQGQGHETTLAQIAADALGICYDRVHVIEGDTAAIAHGSGTYASRTAVTAGSAVHLAATALRSRIDGLIRRASDESQAEIMIGVDAVLIGEREIPLAELIRMAERPLATADDSTQSGATPGLVETAYFFPPAATFASSTHAAMVEVDPETGSVRVIKYVVVDDSGTVINAAIVDGQQHGGVVHGIGSALYEEAIYDRDGQFITATFMDYLLPTACEVPTIEVIHQSCPSPLNPLGAKGCGEGGAVSAPAAIVNAIVDALGLPGLVLNELPVTPERLVAAVARARSAGNSFGRAADQPEDRTEGWESCRHHREPQQGKRDRTGKVGLCRETPRA